MENLGRTTSGDDVIARSGTTLLGHDLLQHGGLEQQHRQRLGSMENLEETASNDIVIENNDLLDCPICFHALATPIFECLNGHLACSTCCARLMKKCPSCFLPMGDERCLRMEKVVEEVKQGKKLAHEKASDSDVLYCPAPNCEYLANYMDLYRHYTACHKARCSRFRPGQYDDACVNIMQKYLVLQEYDDGPLFVLQCFKGAHGLSVALNLMAPSGLGVRELGYDLIYLRGNEKIVHKSNEMTRIQRVSFEAPVLNYMFIPYFALDESFVLKMEIRIRGSGGDDEEEHDEPMNDEDEDGEE
ncbi:hypothetical protein CARUB_v10022334mg [Capsella rubella]|uniref:E3 ubiquitin-protein ligase Sina-like RING finger domain-containing protein n=1 Tax=Capsella rubella TaxID=81985 RepID=R0GFX8_9BRAS|nr:E3 ubiquitin-protein ligase SINA-like 2 [Capsella rubella]EOA34762.1 hypothetical protein CARUB_v10022334mg [Capsella rubella]